MLIYTDSYIISQPECVCGGGGGGGGDRRHWHGQGHKTLPCNYYYTESIIFCIVSSGEHALIHTPRRVIIPGEDTVFTCRVTGTVEQIQWLVNGTRLEDINKRDGIEDEVIFGLGSLTFSNVSVGHKDTTIQCIVTLTSGEIIRSNNATLLVQGNFSY